MFWHSYMESAELDSCTTICDMSNYILPDTIGVTSRINGDGSFILSGKLQNYPEMLKLFFLQ